MKLEKLQNLLADLATSEVIRNDFTENSRLFLQKRHFQVDDIISLSKLSSQDIKLFAQGLLIKKTRPLVRDVIKKINAIGFVHLQHVLSYSEFIAIAHQVGKIIDQEDIKIDDTSRFEINLPDKIAFHTDAFEVDIIGWYCVTPDPHVGENCLLDLADIVHHFSEEALYCIEQIQFKCFGAKTNDFIPLIQRNDDRYCYYYHPWGDPKFPADHKAKDIFNQFLLYLNNKIMHDTIKIRLRAGEILFIDNKRMLHGREAISAHSQRFLKRVWIKRNV